MAGIFQNDTNLLFKVIIEVALERRNRIAAEAVNDRAGAIFFHVVIENFFGIHTNQRARRARSHAPSLTDENFFARSFGSFNNCSAQLVGALAGTGQIHTDVDFKVVLFVLLVDAFSYLFQFFNCHSTAHLSNCASICSPVTSPAISPSERTTGARLHAPTQRAVIKLIWPSLVV